MRNDSITSLYDAWFDVLRSDWSEFRALALTVAISLSALATNLALHQKCQAAESSTGYLADRRCVITLH